ncbi:nucleotidyl transferase AbiEii/AbiGii toxin family protein [Maribellus maritimus]|uniref:nucleotidyl transferase AbiEii/AbiGii toxin family protein n=1 Tax=Maribellus maritimus TaxID=2870838 RepID=UPI001EEA7686|nr:nucleotidyl transferase AbiEii/AbiGii toxin family protein [Maribellus maritimus]MCG6187701.1 nucleotidyl transferase AbiEii/AbiGii toxin family protein [Maribellus maritimus]
MISQLKYKTVKPQLKNILSWLMEQEIFDPFRLVGGTALSLQLGHRESVDIDLFTEAPYGEINFDAIDKYLKDNFEYVDSPDVPVAMGKSYFIGNSAEESIKLDLFYTDPFIQPALKTDNIRLATLYDITAMKIDVVSRGARKKDFWDLHELLDFYSIPQMIQLHEERYPYSHDADEIFRNFTNFEIADNDFEPICLKGKYWELIKLDFVEAIETLSKEQS